MDRLTTYFWENWVYLVDEVVNIAYVYSREGEYRGVGQDFSDYLTYMGHPTPDKE